VRLRALDLRAQVPLPALAELPLLALVAHRVLVVSLTQSNSCKCR